MSGGNCEAAIGLIMEVGISSFGDSSDEQLFMASSETDPSAVAARHVFADGTEARNTDNDYDRIMSGLNIHDETPVKGVQFPLPTFSDDSGDEFDIIRKPDTVKKMSLLGRNSGAEQFSATFHDSDRGIGTTPQHHFEGGADDLGGIDWLYPPQYDISFGGSFPQVRGLIKLFFLFNICLLIIVSERIGKAAW